MLQIGNAPLLQKIYQLTQRLVGIVRIVDHIVVEYQVVAGPVGHQHIAVPVQDLTPSGSHAAPCGIGGIPVAVRICIPDL